MNSAKFEAMVIGFENLITDYKNCKFLPAKLALAEMIVEFAENLVEIYNSEEKSADKKSEMPCNDCDGVKVVHKKLEIDLETRAMLKEFFNDIF